MNADSYYQPPEPQRETEEVAYCRECEEDQWHLVLVWSRSRIERTCQECGEMTELEGEDL